MFRWLIVALLVTITGASTAFAQPNVTKPPKLIQAQAPEYPPAALAAGKQAKVKVRVHIDAEGLVTKVDVLEQVGDGFDEAAVKAAEQYIFEPAEIDGKPAAIVVETAINFTIEQVEEPDPLPPRPDPTVEKTGPPNHAGNLDLPVNLEGEAVERGTRRKLVGVIVSLVPEGKPAEALDLVTGADGTFHFHGVAPGGYKLLAVDDKFDRLERPVVIEKRETVEVRLWMRPKGGNLYETVVEGEREQLEVTKRTLQRQQLTSVPGTFGDPIRAIQSLPGIARSPFGLGLLLVRGSNPDDTGIMVDGHQVPSLFHFLGGPSIFNAEMLESIDLYPGGFPARFGRKHGGIVALELRPSKSDGIHGSAKVDFLDTGVYLRAPITKDLSFAVAGRRSYVDAFLGFFIPEPGPGATRVVTPVYYDYSARLDYDLKGDGRVSLFAIGSSDTLKVLDENPDEMVSQNLSSAISFFRVIGTYQRNFGDGDLKLTMSPAWGRDTISFTGAQAEAAGPFTSVSVVNNNLSYRMRLHGRVSERLAIDTGLDMFSRATTFEALVPFEDNPLIPQGADINPAQLYRGSQSVGVGLHADAAIDVTTRLRIIPGIRVDGYLLNSEERSSIDPRIVARYKVTDELTAKGYVGRFSQPPQPEALDSRFGNPKVGIELAEHYGAGLEWKPDRLWLIDGEIYLVNRHDIVVFTNDFQTDDQGNRSRVNFANTGIRDSYGLEMLIKREISEHWYGWLSYTFSRAHQQLDEFDRRTKTNFDQPHVLNAVASYKPGNGWEFGARFLLSSGRPITPTIGGAYDGDEGGYDPVLGPQRSERVKTFMQLDVRAAKKWTFDVWSLEAYLDVINATYRDNVEALQYDYRFRDSAPITSLPILPTLGVKGTW